MLLAPVATALLFASALAMPTKESEDGGSADNTLLMQALPEPPNADAGWYLASKLGQQQSCKDVCGEQQGLRCDSREMYKHNDEVATSNLLKDVLKSEGTGNRLQDSEICHGGNVRHGNMVDAIDHNGEYITFETPYNKRPVVIVGPLGFAGTDDATAEVVDITTTGFKLRTRETEYHDDSHKKETVAWAAFEEREHKTDEGVPFLVGRHSWTVGPNGSPDGKVHTIPFADTKEFTANAETIVIPMIQGGIREPKCDGDDKKCMLFTNLRHNKISDDKKGFEIVIDRAKKNTGLPEGTTVEIGYIAMPPGDHKINGRFITAQIKPDKVDHDGHTFRFPDLCSPRMLAVASHWGGDNGNLRTTFKDVENGEFHVTFNECDAEECGYGSAEHMKETVRLIVIGGCDVNPNWVTETATCWKKTIEQPEGCTEATQDLADIGNAPYIEKKKCVYRSTTPKNFDCDATADEGQRRLCYCQKQDVYTEGWFAALNGQSCAEQCKSKNLKCDSTRMYQQMCNVDSEEGMKPLLDILGFPGNYQFSTAHDSAMAPWIIDSALVAKTPEHIPKDFVNCNSKESWVSEKSSGRRRLCYCVAGEGGNVDQTLEDFVTHDATLHCPVGTTCDKADGPEEITGACKLYRESGHCKLENGCSSSRWSYHCIPDEAKTCEQIKSDTDSSLSNFAQNECVTSDTTSNTESCCWNNNGAAVINIYAQDCASE